MTKGDKQSQSNQQNKQNQSNQPNKQRNPQEQIQTKNDWAGGKKTSPGRENENQNRPLKDDKKHNR